MKTAETFAELSSARRLHVGAIIVKDDRIISIGYNGMPSGWDNNCEYEEIYHYKLNDEVYELKTRPEVLHAETNAIAKLARSNESGLGSSMFITHSPCVECSKGIYVAGISEVFYSEEYRSDEGIKFLKKCGVNVKTLNSAIMEAVRPDFLVPVFQCQLSKDIDKNTAKGVGKKLLEYKLDGVRVLTVVYPNGEVTQFSRTGKEFNNFTAIKERFATVAYTLSKPLVFDGEVMSTSFQDLMKQARREDNVETENLELNLFDVIPLEDFLKGKCEMPQASRSAYLKLWYSENSYALPNVNLLPQVEVDLDTPEGIAAYDEFNLEALDKGYEGIMIKDPLAPYECKVGTNWMKRKPFIEVTLAVIGFEEGEGQFEGSLGALVCQGVDDGIEITVTVGGGFTPVTRADIWEDRENMIGRMVEIRAGEITQNQNGNYSLRFPRFLRFRDDK